MAMLLNDVLRAPLVILLRERLDFVEGTSFFGIAATGLLFLVDFVRFDVRARSVWSDVARVPRSSQTRDPVKNLDTLAQYIDPPKVARTRKSFLFDRDKSKHVLLVCRMVVWPL